MPYSTDKLPHPKPTSTNEAVNPVEAVSADTSNPNPTEIHICDSSFISTLRPGENLMKQVQLAPTIRRLIVPTHHSTAGSTTWSVASVDLLNEQARNIGS